MIHFLFFVFSKGKKKQVKKSQLAKILQCYFLFSLKIGLVGPVDQQINLVSPKGHIFKKVNKETKRLRDLDVPFYEYLYFFQKIFILIFESSGKVELFFNWNSRISIYEKDYQYLTCQNLKILNHSILNTNSKKYVRSQLSKPFS